MYKGIVLIINLKRKIFIYFFGVNAGGRLLCIFCRKKRNFSAYLYEDKI